jgi:hypothetical protein
MRQGSSDIVAGHLYACSMMNAQPPSTAQWSPSAESSRPKLKNCIVIGLVVVGLIAVAALVLGVINAFGPTSSSPGAASRTASPSVAPEQGATAKKNLCSVYQVAARSVKEETNGGDRALASVSLTNAAAMLDSASDDPALDGSQRDAARTLASAYRTVVAIGSVFDSTSPVGQGALDDANRADAAMATICP